MDTLHQQQAAAQIEVEKPFPQEEELAEKSARLAELNAQLDVDVLTHECGHAFEGYVAERDPNVPADLECPAMESAEIHSMAMEFLTAPWHHLLFGKDTEKYALLHAEDSFVFLAYGCAVDEFQHIMYQNPDLTPDQRNAEWLKLE